MQNIFLKKGLVFVVICLFIITAIPQVMTSNANETKIVNENVDDEYIPTAITVYITVKPDTIDIELHGRRVDINNWTIGGHHKLNIEWTVDNPYEPKPKDVTIWVRVREYQDVGPFSTLVFHFTDSGNIENVPHSYYYPIKIKILAGINSGKAPVEFKWRNDDKPINYIGVRATFIDFRCDHVSDADWSSIYVN